MSSFILDRCSRKDIHYQGSRRYSVKALHNAQLSKYDDDDVDDDGVDVA